MRDEIQLSYQGQCTTFAALSRITGMSVGVLYARWKRIGKPHEIPESILGVACKKTLPYQITLDGDPVTVRRLEFRFGLGKSSIKKKIKLHSGVLLTEHFQETKKAVKETPISPVQVKTVKATPKPKKKIVAEDRSPGWLERREFPKAGDNGFCKVEVANSGHKPGLEGMPFYTG